MDSSLVVGTGANQHKVTFAAPDTPKSTAYKGSPLEVVGASPKMPKRSCLKNQTKSLSEYFWQALSAVLPYFFPQEPAPVKPDLQVTFQTSHTSRAERKALYREISDLVCQPFTSDETIELVAEKLIPRFEKRGAMNLDDSVFYTACEVDRADQKLKDHLTSAHQKALTNTMFRLVTEAHNELPGDVTEKGKGEHFIASALIHSKAVCTFSRMLSNLKSLRGLTSDRYNLSQLAYWISKQKDKSDLLEVLILMKLEYGVSEGRTDNPSEKKEKVGQVKRPCELKIPGYFDQLIAEALQDRERAGKLDLNSDLLKLCCLSLKMTPKELQHQYGAC